MEADTLCGLAHTKGAQASTHEGPAARAGASKRGQETERAQNVAGRRPSASAPTYSNATLAPSGCMKAPARASR